jgi:hypothetical protein
MMPLANEGDPVKYKGLAHISALYVPWSNGWNIMGKVFKKRKIRNPGGGEEGTKHV